MGVTQCLLPAPADRPHLPCPLLPMGPAANAPKSAKQQKRSARHSRCTIYLTVTTLLPFLNISNDSLGSCSLPVYSTPPGPASLNEDKCQFAERPVGFLLVQISFKSAGCHLPVMVVVTPLLVQQQQQAVEVGKKRQGGCQLSQASAASRMPNRKRFRGQPRGMLGGSIPSLSW